MPGEFDIRRTLAALRRRYTRRAYGAVGVGYGVKLVAGAPTADQAAAVHFYVKAKALDAQRRTRRLPGFVLARDGEGVADRRRRIPTDVIPVGDVTAVSRGGVEITTLNERGVISLLFQHKGAGPAQRYLLTCAHVVGPMSAAVPFPDWVRLNDGSTADYATTLFASTAAGGTLEFDVAIARLPAGSAFTDCEVDTLPVLTLSGMLQPHELRPMMPVRCLLGLSGEVNGFVLGTVALPEVSYPVGQLTVDNTFLVNVAVQPGHSGSPVYADDRLVGFVYARSDEGMAWCHLAAPALAFVAARTGLDLSPFLGGSHT